MNEWLLDLINGYAGNNGAVDEVAKFCASYGIYLVAGLLVVFGVTETWNRPVQGLRVAMAAIVSLATAGVIVFVVGSVFTETRPFVNDPDTVQLLSHAADNSFPSDHTTVLAAAVFVGMLAWPRWGWVFLVGLLLMGVARVFVGIHYPGDIAGGMFIGLVGALLGWYVSGLIEPRLPPRLRELRTPARQDSTLST